MEVVVQFHDGKVYRMVPGGRDVFNAWFFFRSDPGRFFNCIEKLQSRYQYVRIAEWPANLSPAYQGFQ